MEIDDLSKHFTCYVDEMFAEILTTKFEDLLLKIDIWLQTDDRYGIFKLFYFLSYPILFQVLK